MTLQAIRILALPLQLARLRTQHQSSLGSSDGTWVGVGALSVRATEGELAEGRIGGFGEGRSVRFGRSSSSCSSSSSSGSLVVVAGTVGTSVRSLRTSGEGDLLLLILREKTALLSELLHLLLHELHLSHLSEL